MYTDIYTVSLPPELLAMAETPVMQRLLRVGMHCGCEYTAYPIYRDAVAPYSRYTHSLGTASIVWHFTHDLKQSVAGLLHDIATPAFAHVVDFLNGDHMRQESTESRTRMMIASSLELMALLDKSGLTLDDVDDYHRYPIADNDSPRLSADRLEYTLGNAHLVFHCPKAELKRPFLTTSLSAKTRKTSMSSALRTRRLPTSLPSSRCGSRSGLSPMRTASACRHWPISCVRHGSAMC